LLSKLEETLVVGNGRFELSANRYPGAIHPQGYQYLTEFRLDPFPVFTYRIGDIELEKCTFMVHGRNTTVVEYELRGAAGQNCMLEVRPLIAFRDYHATTHANTALNPAVASSPGHIAVTPYDDLPTLHFAHDAASVTPAGDWYYNFEYDLERERGLDYREDLFSPFVATFDLVRHSRATIIASTDPRKSVDAPTLRLKEIARRANVQQMSPSDDPLAQALTSATDQFIVRRGDVNTVIAGYHWFGDWGRDTMIALPGLTLVTGRADLAKSILLEFARHVDSGLLPNHFPETGAAPEYNTIDATLWFFEAVRKLLEYTGDFEFVKSKLYSKMANMIGWQIRGTRYGIHVDQDGLLAGGGPGVQLTWMDAKVGDQVITPRSGKPVEVQALWYNALMTLEALAAKFDDDSTSVECLELAILARKNFEPLFWNEAGGYLYDVVDGGRRDAAIRPNQILAVSLHHSMLSPEKARSVVDVVARELLTPYGLLTLASGDPNYRSRYEGDPWTRDSAYHQGTVWPWLLGPFVTAYMKVNGRTDRARRNAAGWLHPFREHLSIAGLGQISEIFDGDPPHTPRGCIAQAWSVAELLRVLAEDIHD
jgi:predicted glycogen debranching enzyme